MPEHGSRNCYNTNKCHRPECRAAHSAYQQAWRAKKAAGGLEGVKHGVYSTRDNYGCGCAPCVEASRVWHKAYDAKRRCSGVRSERDPGTA